jgi:hypothetical protein
MPSAPTGPDLRQLQLRDVEWSHPVATPTSRVLDPIPSSRSGYSPATARKTRLKSVL